MIRHFAVLGLVLGLAACSGGGKETLANSNARPNAPQAAFMDTSGDSRTAKSVFGHISSPAQFASEPIGFYSEGCQAGAVQLPETGPTWQAMRLSRNRNWGQPILVDYIEDLSRKAAQLPGWEGLYVGDMSQPRGGPMISGHASHQTGLDTDVWFTPPQRLNLTASERENVSAVNLAKTRGAYPDSGWTAQHESLLKAAASDPRVLRIFVFPGAKVSMCDHAGSDRAWLRKIRPWYGHQDHFHVRLKCPEGAENCRPQDPPPPGDGCDQAREWVSNILNPPPPDPNAPAPTPSGPTRMSDLPGQCGAVAAN